MDDAAWLNTTAIDLGVQKMGGTCVHIPVSLGGKEVIPDLAKYLDNWFDLLAVRTPNIDALREFADAARAPVVNLRTRSNHPCETLSFIRKKRGTVDRLKVAAVAPAGNIIHSWGEAAKVLPLILVQIYPSKYFMDEIFWAAKNIKRTEDMDEIEDVDVIITVTRQLCSDFRSRQPRLITRSPNAFFCRALLLAGAKRFQLMQWNMRSAVCMKGNPSSCTAKMLS